MTGIIVREIDGKTVGFHFGNEMLVLCEDEGLSLSAIPQLLKDKPFRTINRVLYNAALGYCNINRTEKNFDAIDISKFIDEVGGFASALELVTDSMKANEPKNLEALEKQG